MINKFLLVFFALVPVFSWSQTSYVVRKGDTLLKIADKTLGSPDKKDPRRYEIVKKIRALNPDLKDPNVLELGQTLTIPNDIQITTAAKSVAAPQVALKPPPSAVTAHPAEPVVVPVVEPAIKAELPPPSFEKEPVSAHEETPAKPVPPSVQASAVDTKPAPALEVVKPQEAKKEEAHHNFFFVQPRYQIVKIKAKEIATETEASMTSKSSFGVDVQYGVVLSERLHMLFQAGVTSTQFKDIEIEGDSAIVPVVDHKSETLKSFSLGIGYQVASRMLVDFMLMYADRTFLLPHALPDYELHAVAIPGAELNVSFDIFKGTSNIFGISFIGEFIGALTKDHVEYKSTVEPIGALYWKSNRGHDRMNYKVTLMYKKGHQDTDISKQHEDLGSLGVGFYF